MKSNEKLSLGGGRKAVVAKAAALTGVAENIATDNASQIAGPMAPARPTHRTIEKADVAAVAQAKAGLAAAFDVAEPTGKKPAAKKVKAGVGVAVDANTPGDIAHTALVAQGQSPDAIWTPPDVNDETPVVQEIKLSGVSRDVAFNAYPFEELMLGQEVWLVADPYGAVVKQTKVSMPGDENNGHSDPTAISVQDAPEGGRHIGYVPKKMAAVLSAFRVEYPHMRSEANIMQILGGVDDKNYGVVIIVRFFEQPAVAA